MSTHQIMPMFPLGIVAFPFENLNLHIFEPRYIQLITECEATGTHFGIPPFIEKKMKTTGTEMKLLSIEKVYNNGEMDIKTQGVGIFNIIDFFPKMDNKLYAGAEIEKLELDLNSDFISNQKILEYMEELFEVLKINKPLPIIDGNFNTYQIAHNVGFSIEQEFEFLQILEEENRHDYLLDHLQKLIPLVRDMHKLQERAKLNGHFKHLKSPDFEI